MSLLIDALKQAEAARAQAQNAPVTPTAEGIELEPLPIANNAPAEPASSIPSPRSPISEPRRPRPQAAASSNIANNAARELFDVKHQAPNRLPIILAVTAGLLFVGGAGYVWWATQPRNALIAPGFNDGAGKSNPSAVVSLGEVQAVAPSVPATTPEVAASSLQNTPPSRPAAPLTAEPALERSRQRDMFRPAVISKRTPTATAINDSQTQIRGNGAAIDTGDANGIQAAYAAFLAGNYVLARQRYQEVLRQDPRSIDAMNALGLIAWRSGQPDVAERMFRAAVHADPKDVTAMSQLALLYAEGDPTAAESRLRSLIASQPAAGAPYFALGSLLARQERWSEAQQALFQAYTLDSDNPDVLFNLAVCLEHMVQPALARQFYERALQASTHRPAGFDKSVAQSRAQVLGNR